MTCIIELDYTENPEKWILHTGSICWELFCELNPDTGFLTPIARLVSSQLQADTGAEREARIALLNEFFESELGNTFLCTVWEIASDLDRALSSCCRRWGMPEKAVWTELSEPLVKALTEWLNEQDKS